MHNRAYFFVKTCSFLSVMFDKTEDLFVVGIPKQTPIPAMSKGGQDTATTLGRGAV